MWGVTPNDEDGPERGGDGDSVRTQVAGLELERHPSWGRVGRGLEQLILAKAALT